MKNASDSSPVVMTRLSSNTHKKMRELQKRLILLYKRDGAVANVHFLESASVDSLVYVLLLEAEQNLKRSEK